MHSNPPPEQSTAQIEQPHPQDDDEDDDEVIIEPLQYTYTSVNRPNNPIDTSAATATSTSTATGPHTGTTLRDGIINLPRRRAIASFRAAIHDALSHAAANEETIRSLQSSPNGTVV